MIRYWTTLRWIDRASGVIGLASIVACIVMLCLTWWDPRSFAIALIASLFAVRSVLGWLRGRYDGSAEELEADATFERVSECVHDDRPAPQERDAVSFANVIASCKYLPTPLPDGWTRPISTSDSKWWHVSVGREKLLLSRAAWPNGDHVVVRAMILPPPGCTEPVSRERCAEILHPIPNVKAWFELPIPTTKRVRTARNFAGNPEGLAVQKAGPMPAPTPAPEPSRWLEAVRMRHLPELLPEDWSVPVAVPEHDLWMFDAGGYFAMVGYVVDDDRSIRLSVALCDPGGQGNDGAAAAVLGKLRNVKAFLPRRTEQPNTTMYFGDVIGGDLPRRAPEGALRTLLN